MEISCTEGPVTSTKTSGRPRPGADRIVRRKFPDVAKVLWAKPDATIATIAKCDPRTGRRMLRGEVDVPVEVAMAAIAEMLRPLD